MPQREEIGPLRVERAADRVVATLDRPSARNAVDRATVDALHVLCAGLEVEPRTLILTGANGDLAAGADIAELLDRDADDARAGINTHAFDRIAALPMPVIAAIDGYALGGGAELAYAADLRIGTPRMRIGSLEPTLGIMPAAGATWRLPAMVGVTRAHEMLLTARVLTGDEALAWGVVTALHAPEDLLPAAHELADRIARLAPGAVRHTKTALRARPDQHPRLELDLQAELFESDEKRRRMSAFLHRKRRDPAPTKEKR
ncbi:enoyl-CoA hydratase/isomerase family protein [Myceligenerans salitolerans]|uniref:Enoyl-CoA hydratase/isomerase family protein n=1 Tax=Myceligenerans salitolerans TaxID=1230528 RepID=A0ABS3I9E9_9MICO|nr:enoyl-CoA hydratase/isomerase family protein [Myceligenerans salitolerans]MBO0609633.1 enoyl-CoA hydratase/isomerase family protein [Myceligenerans salitolerans]